MSNSINKECKYPAMMKYKARLNREIGLLYHFSFFGFLLLLLCITKHSSAASSSDKSPKTDLTELSIEELANVEVVVAASKHEQKTSQAPASVTIITSDDIKKYGYRTLADALKSVRGFYVSYDRNYHFLGMRGFSPPGDYDTRVLLMIDGHRMNDQIYQQTSIGTEFPLDVDLIDRVEIVRGPCSSLYGSNALFGVINIITKGADSFDGVEVSFDSASYDSYKARLTYGFKPKEGISVVASGSFYNSEGQTLFYEEFNDPLTNNGFTKYDADEYQDFFAAITSDDLIIHALSSRREKEIPTGSWGTLFDNPDNATVDRRNYIDIALPHKFNSGIEIVPRIYFDQYFYDGDYAYESDTHGEILVNKDESEADWWGAEITAVKHFTERHSLTVGSEFTDSFHVSQKNYDSEVYFDDERNFTYWALYVQDEIWLCNNLLLNAGIRYDHYESFGETVNPRIGLIYSFTPETTLKLLYGTAFRAPNPYELFYEDGTGFQKANPNLNPETMKTYEVVLEKNLSKNLILSLAAFHYKLDDLITLSQDPTDGLLVFENIESAESNGAEFEISKKWQNGVNARASYTYQRTKDELTEEMLVNSPKNLAKLNLLFPLVSETVFTGIEFQYTGNRRTLAGNAADDFTVTNLTLFAGKLKGNWEISASVYNLFDVQYYAVGSEEHVQDMIEQDGRSFRLKLTHKF
jgi:outer membrane receptor protein involved in Fe transport